MTFSLQRYIAGAYVVRDRIVRRHNGRFRVTIVIVPRQRIRQVVLKAA